jgi:hypothetical protein
MKKKKLPSYLHHILIVSFAFAAMGIMGCIAMNMSFLNPVAQTMKDFTLTDIYYHVLQDYGRIDTSRVITIVDMTDLHSRADIADVLEEIESMNPKVVGVDIVFEGLKTDTIADMRLADLAGSCQNTMFSYRLNGYVNDSLGYGEEVHSFFSDFVEIEEGFTNFERALYGGLKRKVSLYEYCRGEKRNSLVYEVAQRYTDGNLVPHKSSLVNINFRPTFFRKIPHDSIAKYRHLIENQIVLYGATNELYDTHYTPLGQMAGVELLAYSIQTLLEQTEVRYMHGWVTFAFSFLLVYLTCVGRINYLKWAKSRKQEWLAFLLTTTFIVGFLLFMWTAFLVWIGFVLFVLTGYCLNLGWTMAAIPLLGGAGEFFGLTIRRCLGGHFEL